MTIRTQSCERRAGSVRRVRILLVSQMYPGPADPDLGTFVAQMVQALAAVDATQRAHELLRVVPQFRSQRYTTPHYLRLADDGCEEIRRGASDRSAMGVYHDLYEPQREANLAARLQEYVPAGTDAGILFVD